MSDLLGPVAAAVENAMRFRVARQAVLASNLANVDTPGYRRSDLHFEAKLDSAVRLGRTSAGHHTPGGLGVEGWRLETESRPRGPDRNGVDPDRETVEVGRNAGAFGRQAEVYARLLMMMRTAIDGASS